MHNISIGLWLYLMKLYFLLYTSDEIWWKYINQIFKDLPLVGKADNPAPTACNLQMATRVLP